MGAVNINLIDRIRTTRAGYLCRHEARLAGKRSHSYAVYAIAGFLDVGALAALVILAASSEGHPAPELVLTGVLIVALLAAIAIFATVGLMIPAMAGEKSDGTLESLMLAPVSRREVLWGKLIGRMTPVRVFMRASIPAFVLGAQCIAITVGLGAGEGLQDMVGRAMVLGIFVILGLVATAIFWVLLLVDAHCAAAITLYCSARARGPVTASMAAYGAVFVPPIVMSCGYGAGLLYHFFAGPIMFSELIRNLDRFTIEADWG